MAVYNSSVSLNQDDTDVTIINHSFLYGCNDEPMSTCLPVLRRLQKAYQSSNKTQPITSKPANNPLESNNRPDYIYVEHESIQVAKQIEQIVDYYRKELKQDSNTQIDCSRQLITRLVDFIRPTYSSDQHKMKDLDILYKEISVLHDKRALEEKEKNEQLNNKIRHLKKSIVSTAPGDDSRDSLMVNLYRINSIVDYEQWMEIEEETKKLHNLVQTQRDQIDKLVELLSQADTIKNENYHTAVNSIFPSSEESKTSDKKTCSLCNYEFPITFTLDQIINHFEQCLTTSGIEIRTVPTEVKHWECPYCNQKFLNTDEMSYLEHASTCCNEMADNS